MKVLIVSSARDEALAGEIEDALSARGYEPIQRLNDPSAGTVISAVTAAVRAVDAVVVMLTSASPLVYYELGLAVGAGKPVLLATRVGEGPPSDFAALPHVQLADEPMRDAEALARRQENP